MAAEAAGVDALVAVYHSDHRELCAHERDWPFRIMNMYEIVGASMGLHHDDHFKRLKIMQDADAILADCRDLVSQHGLDPETTRLAIQAMLDEQPLPLRRPLDRVRSNCPLPARTLLTCARSRWGRQRELAAPFSLCLIAILAPFAQQHASGEVSIMHIDDRVHRWSVFRPTNVLFGHQSNDTCLHRHRRHLAA